MIKAYNVTKGFKRVAVHPEYPLEGGQIMDTVQVCEISVAEVEQLKKSVSTAENIISDLLAHYEAMKRQMAMHWDAETYDAFCSLELEQGMDEALTKAREAEL